MEISLDIMTQKYFRKVIRIRAEDSPNVQYGLKEIELGLPPSNKIILEGVLPMEDYVKRRKTWDDIQQCIGLDGMFYEGSEIKMFPSVWLNRAENIARELKSKNIPRCINTKKKSMGIDPAEGGDKTTYAVCDHLGLVELISKRTPDTNEIIGQTIALMKKYNIEGEQVFFDRGGGGKQHADRLREKGFNVNTIAFGESATPEETRRHLSKSQVISIKETKYTYKNKRAEMYGMIRESINPEINEIGFAIPEEYKELRRQLECIPLLYDNEGRIRILSKNKRGTNTNEKTLIDIIGHSPDESDAFALSIYGLMRKSNTINIGAI